MRKLTPEERAAKKALADAGAPAEHTHDENCGHLEEAPAPKRKKKAEEPAPEAVAVVEEPAPVAEAPAVEASPAVEAPAEESASDL